MYVAYPPTTAPKSAPAVLMRVSHITINSSLRSVSALLSSSKSPWLRACHMTTRPSAVQHRGTATLAGRNVSYKPANVWRPSPAPTNNPRRQEFASRGGRQDRRTSRAGGLILATQHRERLADDARQRAASS